MADKEDRSTRSDPAITRPTARDVHVPEQYDLTRCHGCGCLGSKHARNKKFSLGLGLCSCGCRVFRPPPS